MHRDFRVTRHHAIGNVGRIGDHNIDPAFERCIQCWIGDVAVDDGVIAAVGVAPAGGRGLAVAGFVDLQVNGFAGIDFTHADTANAIKLSSSTHSSIPVTNPTATARFATVCAA